MPETLKNALLEKLEGRSATVCVVGLGYVGLPLAIAIARAGHRVVGVDRAPHIVDAVNEGRAHIEGIDVEELGRRRGLSRAGGAVLAGIWLPADAFAG